MGGSRRGGQGVWTPLKNHRNIGFSSNTGPDPLKITRLPSQHSFSHHRHDSETPLKMAFRWRADVDPLMVVFCSSLPSSTKKKKSKLDPLWHFLDPRMYGEVYRRHTVGNLVLRRSANGDVKRDLRTFIRRYSSPYKKFEYGYHHSNIYSNKKETSDLHGTVSFDPVKILQQK